MINVEYISTIAGLKKIFNLEMNDGFRIKVWCTETVIEAKIIKNLESECQISQYLIYPDEEIMGTFTYPTFYQGMNRIHPDIRSGNPIYEEWEGKIINLNL